MEAIGGKTATLFELCAGLGAEGAAAPSGTVEAVSECAWQLGIAFQILDDVMDLLGPSDVGKVVGKDLLQGVYTLPVIYAVEESPQLRGQLGPGVTSGSLPSVLEAVRAAGGPERALEDAAGYARSARDSASTFVHGEELATFIDEVLLRPLEVLS